MVQKLDRDMVDYPDPKGYCYQLSRMSYMNKVVANDTQSDAVKYDVKSSNVKGSISCELIMHDDDSSQYEMIRTAPQKKINDYTTVTTYVTYYLFKKNTPLFIIIDNKIRQILIKKRGDIFTLTLTNIATLPETILLIDKIPEDINGIKTKLQKVKNDILESTSTNFNYISSINNKIKKLNPTPEDCTKIQTFEQGCHPLVNTLNTISEAQLIANIVALLDKFRPFVT